MKKFTFYALLIYFLSASLNLMAIHFQNDIIASIFKWLLMPALGSYLVFSWTGKKSTVLYLTLLALLFSWIGDIVFTFHGHGKWIFALGLVAFALAHACYTITFKTASVSTQKRDNRLFVVSRIFIFLFIAIALYNSLWNEVDELKIPIAIYILATILMAIFAVLRRAKTSPSSFSLVYSGALMFIVSEGMILISKFLNPFPYNGVLIMLTYVLAQFLIISGVIKHNAYPESDET